MNNKNTLIELRDYFYSVRNVGHTTAMMEGAKNVDCIVLSHCEEGTRFIKSLDYQGDVKSVHQIGGGKLKGLRKPMVLDNAALVEVLNMALIEIEKQEARVEKVKNLAHEILSV